MGKARCVVALPTSAAILVCGPAAANDLRNVDFSLRLPAALAVFSPYSDVAGFGGASAGSRYASSINPGATDWQPAPVTDGQKRPFAASPQYTTIRFSQGLTLHVLDESATYKTEALGTFQPAVVQLRHEGSTAGDFLVFDADYGQLQWGKKVGEGTAIGVNLNYTSFDTRQGRGGAVVGTNHSDTYDIRVGALQAVTTHTLVGLVVEYSAAPATTTALSLDCGCFVNTSDTTTAILARPGLSYEYAELSSIYMDFLLGRFSNATGSFVTHRAFVGVEQRFTGWLYGRAGLAYDFRGTLSSTVGFGLYPSDSTSIDIAFQNNMYPELVPELGRSRQFGISATFSF